MEEEWSRLKESILELGRKYAEQRDGKEREEKEVNGWGRKLQ